MRFVSEIAGLLDMLLLVVGWNVGVGGQEVGDRSGDRGDAGEVKRDVGGCHFDFDESGEIERYRATVRILARFA